ncbi:MAG: ABC transporter permease [Streptococcaceae bacterium]|jgi:ABC-2 type transport system permease protein|nr:ABC transporter permease [Streptococcaceae bacterium]
MNIFEKKNRILLRELIKTDFKLRYQGSAIGYLWSILKPIMLFIVMYLVFVKFLKFGSAVPHFAVALLLGITVWNFFAESTMVGMQAIVNRGDLLRKINFSKVIIVLSVVANAFINLLISTVVVIIFSLINGVHMSWNVIFVLPLLFELLLFTIGIVLLLSTAYVYFRDLSPVWEVAMQAGMYATPIIYPITEVALRGGYLGQIIADLMMLNPMAQIIQDLRYILTFSNNTNPTVWQMIHHPFYLVVPYILPFFIFAFGSWVFNRNANKFAEVI